MTAALAIFSTRAAPDERLPSCTLRPAGAETHRMRRTNLGAQGDSGPHPRRAGRGVRLNEHLEHPDAAGVRTPCKMGVKHLSPALGSRFRSALALLAQFKNPDAPALSARL